MKTKKSNILKTGICKNCGKSLSFTRKERIWVHDDPDEKTESPTYGWVTCNFPDGWVTCNFPDGITEAEPETTKTPKAPLIVPWSDKWPDYPGHWWCFRDEKEGVILARASLDSLGDIMVMTPAEFLYRSLKTSEWRFAPAKIPNAPEKSP
jgi:hypothetical protein